MTSNTTKRIISALVMVFIACGAVYYGKSTTSLLVLVAGALVNDEIMIHFFKRTRSSLSYIISQVLYFSCFMMATRFENLQLLLSALGIVLNLGLLWYLFKSSLENNTFSKIGESVPALAFVFSLIPMVSLVYLMKYDNWQMLLILLMVVNFGMDSGAWFFGKSFGKRKLWPSVSPNKTVEGLCGGMLTSGILGYLISAYYFNKNTLWAIVAFSGLGLLSQIGDLAQSKLKRQFKIKDSSSLIPGHGGVYDRIDSLVFVLPFFVGTIYLSY